MSLRLTAPSFFAFVSIVPMKRQVSLAAAFIYIDAFGAVLHIVLDNPNFLHLPGASCVFVRRLAPLRSATPRTHTHAHTSLVI